VWAPPCRQRSAGPGDAVPVVFTTSVARSRSPSFRLLLTLSPASVLLNSSGGGGGGQAAKDANGDAIKSKKWLSTHLPGDRQLTQGLKVRARRPQAGVCVAALSRPRRPEQAASGVWPRFVE